jgi:prepilin-type N-terminal cleavage/methylation domain-containing protein
MKTRSQKGFTLIELMIAVITAVILLLATGTVLFIAQVSWNSAWQKVNLQRDASYAMLKMGRSIKAASSATIDDDGKTIKIYGEDGSWTTFFLGQESNALISQVEGQYPEVIINGRVEDLAFNVQGNKVGIDLKLREANLQTHLVSTLMMRNYGG